MKFLAALATILTSLKTVIRAFVPTELDRKLKRKQQVDEDYQRDLSNNRPSDEDWRGR
jgi:hypothetical protein